MNILHVYKTFLNDTFGGVEQTISQIAKTNGSHIKHTVLSLSKIKHQDKRIRDGIKKSLAITIHHNSNDVDEYSPQFLSLLLGDLLKLTYD